MKNAELKPDETRAHMAYYNQFDYNGKRAIQNKDGSNNIVADGDYALVHFFLKSDNEISPDGVYIFGELSDWMLKPSYKMDYFPDKKYYYKALKLKQSYYNYEYVTVDKEGKPDLTFTEGNHFETENDYDIFIYHKNQQYGFDELIGYLHLNTNTNRR